MPRPLGSKNKVETRQINLQGRRKVVISYKPQKINPIKLKEQVHNINSLPEDVQNVIISRYPLDHLSVKWVDYAKHLKVVETDSLEFLKNQGFSVSHLQPKLGLYIGILVPKSWSADVLLKKLESKEVLIKEE